LARDAILSREGFRVIRIAARDVLKDLDAVHRYIVANCSGVGPLHQPAAGPPPRPGEEL
jgi:very-short-patch-repair endonuclease